MEILEKTAKQELIEKIENTDDDRLINQLLFHMQPEIIIDKDISRALTKDELLAGLKERIHKLPWKK